tara:strand:+ start:53 stop:538 length:486 start_codon:yes stop_codon:yes gene_type:complete
MIKYKYPKSFWKIAEEIGNARNVLNTELRAKNPKYQMGDINLEIDINGMVGELIAMDYLTNKNIDYKMAKLLSLHPPKGADLLINNKRVDVKTTKHFPKAHLLVNEDGHKKGLNLVDTYWFIYLLDNENAEFYFVDYNKINDWDCKVMGYTKAYYIKREKL